MKKIMTFVLAAGMLFTMAGCQESFFEGRPPSDTTKTEGMKPLEEKPASMQFSVSGEGVQSINEANGEIFELLLKKSGGKKNFVLSPLSIQKLLDLLSMATSDREAFEFLKRYDRQHLQGMQLANSRSESLILLNKALLQGAEPKKLPFEAVKIVEFPQEAAKEKRELQMRILQEVLDEESPDADTVVALLDAIRYYSAWQSPFEKEQTKPRDFTTAEGKKLQTPTMMQHFEEARAWVDEEKEIFAMQGEEGAIVYFIKPKKVADSADELSDWVWDFHRESEPAAVDFYLPKVEFKTQIEFLELFESLGLNAMLTGFRLDRFLPDLPLKISKAKQVGSLRVDEKRAEAKAITSIETKMAAMPPKDLKQLEIKMDSPYYIVIEDREKTSAESLIVFMAYIADPTAK